MSGAGKGARLDQLRLDLQAAYVLRPAEVRENELAALIAFRDPQHRYRLASRNDGTYIAHWAPDTGWGLALRVTPYAVPRWKEGAPQNYGQLSRFTRQLLAGHLVTVSSDGDE